MDSLNHALAAEQNDYKKVGILIALCEACDIKDNLYYAGKTIQLVERLKPQTRDTSSFNRLLGQQAFAYIIKGVYYSDRNFLNEDQMVATYDTAINIYKQLKQWDKLNEAYQSLSDSYMRSGNLFMQLQIMKNALDFAKTNHQDIFSARYLHRIAQFYARINDTERAIQYANEGINLEKKINDPKRLAKGYELAGDLFYRLKQYQNAITYYNKALAKYRQNKDSTQYPWLFMGIGNTYVSMKNYEQAHKYLAKARTYTDSVSNNNAFYTEITVEMGRLEHDFKNYTAAKQLFDKALALSLKKGFPGGISVTKHEIAKVLLMQGKYAEAKKFAEEALLLKKQIASAEQVMKTEKLCYQIDSAAGNYKSALVHFTGFTRLQNKLKTDEIKRSSSMEDLQARFEREKQEQKAMQLKKEAEAAAEIRQQRLVRNGLLVGVALLCVIALVILRNYNIKKKYSNELITKNQEILEQKHLIEEKQQEIIDSINYARGLQHAILPPFDFINAHLPDNFILYQPKDIVAGDFYWAEKIEHRFYIAAADSTGHGVPGAMVSVVCSNALNRALKEFGISDTGQLLDKTRELVIGTFEKSSAEVKDGMDISLLCIDTNTREITWSGANNPLWYIQNNELKEIKANKQPIGKTDHPASFTTQRIENTKDTVFYLFTDGLADQFGGPRGKKFKYKQFAELLLSIHGKPMQEQAMLIDKSLRDWKGSFEQVDDICVIGIRF